MIELAEGDITKMRCDAIVNPANSFGTMAGGVALALRTAGGSSIEKEAVSRAPVAVGEAVATAAGGLHARYVIHAPTMEKPAQRTDAAAVAKAARAALSKAAELGVRSIAFPGMGTGTGGVAPRDAAAAMVKEMRRIESSFDKIIIVANGKLHDAFKEALAR